MLLSGISIQFQVKTSKHLFTMLVQRAELNNALPVSMYLLRDGMQKENVDICLEISPKLINSSVSHNNLFTFLIYMTLMTVYKCM